MGLKVHKFAGYGLTDLKPKDERVNWDSPLLTEPDLIPAEDYYQWLTTQQPPAHSMDWMMSHEGDLYGCIASPGDYMLPNVLALRPVSCYDWHRRDDTIDWLTESRPRDGSEGQRPWVQVFDDGIYPFGGLFMDAADGVNLPLNIIGWVQWRNELRPDADPEEVARVMDVIARRYGYRSHAQALERIVPRVPREVRDLAEFGHLFTRPEVWRQLRPLLYTWWSLYGKPSQLRSRTLRHTRRPALPGRG
jgi:hypothetical protein